MRESKINSRPSKRGLTLLATKKGGTSVYIKLGVLVAVLFAVATIFNQMLEIGEKKKHLREIEEKTRIQELMNEEMEWIVQNSDSKTNYERIARSELGLVKPDERVFVFVGGDE